MATFHLYEMEGVAAQLLYSFQKGDAFTAAQAARELLISQEHTFLLNLLQLAWLLSLPSADTDAAAANALEAQDAEALFYALAAAAKAHEIPSPTLPPTIGKPTHNPAAKLPPPTWTAWPKDWTPQMAGDMWWAVHAALQKKHVDRAFRLSQQLLETQDVLMQFLESHGVRPFLIKLLATVAPQLRGQVLLHAYGSIVPSAKPASTPSVEVYRAFTSKRQGGRKGRTFYVTAAALGAWNVAPAPIIRLQGEPTLVAEDTASNYWTVIWKGEGLESDRLVFKDDDACEAFYEKHFPDDIPDEWSAEERAKSHGQPVVDAPKNPWRQAFLLCFANA